MTTSDLQITFQNRKWKLFIYNTSEKNTLAFLKCSILDKTHCLIQFLALASCSILKAPQEDGAVPGKRQWHCPTGPLVPGAVPQCLAGSQGGLSSGMRGTFAGHCSLPPAETGHTVCLSHLWVNCYTGRVLTYTT